ncbi:head protein [Azospirillum argentinense]|uniref:Head protein n=1 Tax=Azospirillum argentinense TaxID=2970906 RepID=A0A060DLB0_9PROT|nr:DUF5309 domain-containing protein [Azospirillum argentinense]AIB11788.1 head protein [Azospirillum argentinense]EZQ08683.1 hypothetical protein ABAZ39_08620 [Azospirillum argentinense]
MALPSNTFSTYAAVGNREDLTDDIYRVAPTETPFVSSVQNAGRAKAVNHEWQTQDLAAPDTGNAVLEGDDATTDAATPTVRLGNICQISDKVARVTGTQQETAKAGRDDELAYQVALKKLELKRDMEAILLNNQAKGAGNTTTARTLAGVESWIKTNTSMGSGGANPSAADGTGTRTDGTQRAFTEAMLKTVLQSIWNEGGNPDTIMVGGVNKQRFSTFTGRATVQEEAKTKKIVAAVDVYESDFGTLKVVPNRFQRARSALVLEMDKWALAFLRNMKEVPLAKTGDSERKQIICEYTLESRNEKASGGVFDLTTT